MNIRALLFIPLLTYSSATATTVDTVANGIGHLSHLVQNLTDVADIISKAHSLVDDKHHHNPVIENKRLRLTFKMTKSLKTLSVLSRQVDNPSIAKNRLTIDIIKTLEQVALLLKEFVITYQTT